MEENYFGNTSKKTPFFYFAVVILILCAGLSINTDLAEFSQHKDLNIPQWFFYAIFFLDFLILSSIALIYFYRKIGVYVMPLAIVIHFLMHNFYLSTMLYSDLNLLFFYFCVGLLVVIPRWKFYK